MTAKPIQNCQIVKVPDPLQKCVYQRLSTGLHQPLTPQFFDMVLLGRNSLANQQLASKMVFFSASALQLRLPISAVPWLHPWPPNPSKA